MIKKIFIEKYGPFKKQGINLENNSDAIHIIGMNDVGKTVLLNAIHAYSKGLNKQFITKSLDNVINDSVVAYYEIKKEMYNPGIKKILKNAGLRIFEGVIRLNINASEFIQKPEVFISTMEMTKWTEEVIDKVNQLLSIIGKNELSKEEGFEYKPLKRVLNGLSKKKNRDIFVLIEAIEGFKKFIYNLLNNSCSMIRANSKDHFEFIQDSYIISKSNNKNGDEVESEWSKIREFLVSFFDDDEIDNIESIIISDNDKADKERRLATFETKAGKTMTQFYKTHFPSQNIEIEFKFKINLFSNELTIFVKDKLDDDFNTLDKRSEGFRWFLKLYIVTKNLRPFSTLIIDEPEKFLHASAQKELTQLLLKLKKKQDIQIIYATHSPYMLTNEIFPSLKIVTKEKEGSIIHNNINSYVNKNDKHIRDVLLPISTALGINIWELSNAKKFGKLLLVEGESDLYTLKLGSFLARKRMTFFTLPLLGKGNPYGIFIVKLLDVEYMIFLDRDKDNNKKEYSWVKESRIQYIDDLLHDGYKVTEDILSWETKEKYNITNKSTTHKIGWQQLYQEVESGTYKLSDSEESLLLELFHKISKFFD